MAGNTRNRARIDSFITEHIDSVPHLEALLLLWRSTSEPWAAESIAKRLWITTEDARGILEDLERDHLAVLATSGEKRQYRANPEHDPLLHEVADAYREEMIRISNMIHAKPSSAVRAFARAFRFTKGKD